MNRRPFVPGMYITLFADASYCPNTHAYGYGWWIKFGAPAQIRSGHGGGRSIASSLEAEVEALRVGLRWVRKELPDSKGKRLVVQSDCTGALTIISVDLAQMQRELKLDAAYTKHVKGHRGTVDPRASVNTTCDRNARRVMLQFREQNLKEALPTPTTLDKAKSWLSQLL